MMHQRIAALGHQALRALVRAHGDSLYVLDVQVYRNNLRELRSLFAVHYGRIGIGHSYKTNYIPQLCQAAYEEGAYAEVVSRMEFDMALRFGAAPERIIVNGPVKDDALLRDALFAGCILNMDGADETRRAVVIMRANPDRRFRIGLRLNLPMNERKRSRFGIDADSNEMKELVSALRSLPNCTIAGIHCHLGGDRSAASYAERTQHMIKAAQWIFPDAPPGYIDIGGGLAGRMPQELQQQLAYPVPQLQDYAAAIAGTFAKTFDATNGPELIVEPGMGVLSDVLWFVCEVAAVKRIGDHGHAIVTGSIYNVKPTLNNFDLPFTVVRQGSEEEGVWTVSGYTCMEIDVVHKAWRGAIAQGDLLVFGNVGAYTVVLKPPFIKAAPAIVMLHADGSTEVVKRAETLEDVLATYRW